MAAPTITNGEEHFFPILYEGNGTARRVGKFVPFTDNATISNSIIFNSADSADKLQATIGASSTANARRKMTLSFWYKWTGTGTNYQTLWTVGGDGQTPYIAAYINNNGSRPKGSITFFDYTGSGSSYNSMIETKRGFADTSKWYHVLFAMDTTQSTDSDRLKIYVDGDLQETDTNNYYSQDFDTGFGTNVAYAYGANQTVSSGGYWFNGYLTEINHVDGTALTPSTFGLTDTSTGRWIPKTLTGITYGDNGHRLKMQDSSALGDDTSGNGNDFTASSLTSANQTVGSPTSNYSIFTTNGSTGTISLAEGNLKPTFSSSAGDSSGSAVPSTFLIPVGKWYFEYYIAGTNSVLINMAVAKTNTNFSGRLFTLSGFKTYYPYVRSFYEGSSELVTDTDMPIGEDDTTVGVYIERKSDGTVNLWAGDDQASKGTFAFQSSMNPATGANAVGNPFSPDDELRLYIGNEGNGNYSSGVRGTFNFGQLKVSPIDSGTNLTDYTSTAGGYFRYQPVTGFKALQQDNMPTTDKGVSGLTWTKDRDAAVSWMCIDSSRIYSAENVPGAMNLNNTNKEYGQVDFVDGINKFLKGGYALITRDNSNSYMNKAGNANVSYSWVANGGTKATNEVGAITSTVQANTTAGFSIVEYTGTGGAASVGHGLSAAPEFMIFKDRDNDSTNWRCFHTGFGNITTYLKLNSDDSYSSASMWGSPTASAFIIGGTGYEVNESGTDYVAYCWHGVDGYSKFNKYVGNSSTDGKFVYLGFRPAFVMIKAYNNGTNWQIWDSARSPSNPITNKAVFPDLTNAEGGTNTLDFLSNGFKLRSTGNWMNDSSYTYLYMAWAENPFVGDGTSPVTAR